MMVAENGNGAGVDGVSTAAPNTSYVNRDELISLRVVVGTKRIFLGLCENDRGRYLKISDGRSKLIIPGSGIPDLRAAIDSLHAFFVQNPDAQPPLSSTEENGGVGERTKREPLSAERFISEGRKFYLDLLCNERGMYVKMSQATSRRVSMIFPAQALSHLQDAMTQLHDLAPPDHTDTVSPEIGPGQIGHHTRTVDRQATTAGNISVSVKATQRIIRTEGKRLVFESGANRRGSYLRISDNSGFSKLSVTIPHGAIPAMIHLLTEAQEAGDPIDELRAAEAAAEATGPEQ